ncbi:MAG: acetyl-CoA C-acetyltransferase [Candidatus Marinimicrobia bacterium]|nr:acetyl-CoA C-acetyltransferase [Candidatus Neomarinimicrobiota bacterium]
MSLKETDIVILEGVRTPFGAFGGSLAKLSATELGVIASKGAIEKSGVSPDKIDNIVFGNALQTSADAIYLARHVGLGAGVPHSTPALTVNRLCGSGFESLIQAARTLMLGEAEFVLAGGAESMSMTPHCSWGVRWGLRLKDDKLVDLLWAALYDPVAKLSMAQTAEKLADTRNISRQEVDEFALLSQQRTAVAKKEGKFDDEIVPVVDKNGNVLLSTDEHPRADTSIDALSKLKPYFKEDGTITAGNASGISDGAAAMVLTTAENAEKSSLKPIGRLVSWGISGCDPTIMGIGPVPSSRKALEKAELSLEEIDLIELNEAFSPQYLAVEKELGLDRDKTNVNGGAIAIGHPLAATGARLTMTLLYELRRSNKKRGLATACIGGGQGAAVIVETV